jgi:hypothetical protein
LVVVGGEGCLCLCCEAAVADACGSERPDLHGKVGCPIGVDLG